MDHLRTCSRGRLNYEFCKNAKGRNTSGLGSTPKKPWRPSLVSIRFSPWSFVAYVKNACYIQVELGLINMKLICYITCYFDPGPFYRSFYFHHRLINHGPRTRKRIKAIIAFCNDKKRRKSHVRTRGMWVSQWSRIYNTDQNEYIYIYFEDAAWQSKHGTIDSKFGYLFSTMFWRAFLSNHAGRTSMRISTSTWWKRKTHLSTTENMKKLWNTIWVLKFPVHLRRPARGNIRPATSLQGSSWQRQRWGHVGWEYFGVFWWWCGWRLQEEF